MHLGRVCTPWAGALFGRFRRSPFQSPRAFCHGMVYSRHYSQNLVGESSRTGVRPSMPAFTLREDDPESFHTFVATLDRNDDKTIAAYLTTLRDLAAWLATQPDRIPFHPALLTVTALEGYFCLPGGRTAGAAHPRQGTHRDYPLLPLGHRCWPSSAQSRLPDQTPDRASAFAHRTRPRAAHHSQEPRRASAVVACGSDLCAGLLGRAAGQR
jgi:hypothetical protein